MSSHPEDGRGGGQHTPRELQSQRSTLRGGMTPVTVLSATTAVKPEPSAIDAAWESSSYAFWEPDGQMKRKCGVFEC